MTDEWKIWKELERWSRRVTLKKNVRFGESDASVSGGSRDSAAGGNTIHCKQMQMAEWKMAKNMNLEIV